ncbi:2-dehydropantoate 2-reductase [Marinobacter sp. HL-58]|uniref:ketopantoate reductase family protein n=1 Tax=Marinobacter sp. HL-58 TaxID=1479237 RepID=UPI00068C2668|nr:2-dehydropantoate 2-reductase [Marinobacter sp. HL-58]KPQ01135.1 MAG: 2-dehydropantoate 2-reductase PanE [Marinobacter sp. HL-58]
MNGLGANQQLPGSGSIAILGAGSLGQLWAGYLPAGSVAFVPRPTPEKEPGASLAYRLERFDGSVRPVSVPWLSVAAAPPSLLLVTTKAGDTLSALEPHLPDLPQGAPIVLFQNGMGSQQSVAERWPRQPVLAASTTEGANRPEPGYTVHAGKGETWVGALTDSATPLLRQVVNTLAASGLTVHPEADIHQRLWDKLLVNAGINAFTAILNCRNGDILNHRFYLEHIDNLCEEIAAVMNAEDCQPLAPHAIRQRIEAVARNTANNTSSMLSDRQQGRTTEIDFINGYIARQGQARGIRVTVNQMLTQQVQQLSADTKAGEPSNHTRPGAS